jgi:hypothetical protein
MLKKWDLRVRTVFIPVKDCCKHGNKLLDLEKAVDLLTSSSTISSSRSNAFHKVTY